MFSARSFTANSGAAYEAGFSVLINYIAIIVGLVVQVWFLAPWMRQMRATTFAEVIRERFDPRTQQLYVWAYVLYFFIVAAIWLWAVAVFVSSVFSYPISFVIVAVGVVALTISTVGGNMAVMASDVVQALIMFGLAGLLTALALIEIGGVGEFVRRISAPEMRSIFTFTKPPGTFPGNQYTASWMWAIFTFTMVIQCSMEFSVRYFAVKDGRAARRAALLAIVLVLLSMPVFFVPAWTARLLYSADVASYTVLGKPAESAFVVTSLRLLPEGLIGLMIVAMLAVTMGSLDAGLNRNAALIVNDALPALMRRLGRHMPSPRAQLRLAEVITVVLGVLCISLAVYFADQKGLGVFEFANDVTAQLALPLAIPMCAGIFWKRVPPWSALVSLVAATIPSACGFISGRFLAAPWSLQQTVCSVLLAGTIAFFATTPWWKSSSPEYRERVDGFFLKMKTPVDFTREIGEPNDRQQSRNVGWFCAVAAGCVLALLPFMHDARGVYSVLGLAGFLMLPAALLLWSARRTTGH
jgi:Na+/proline symporter